MINIFDNNYINKLMVHEKLITERMNIRPFLLSQPRGGLVFHHTSYMANQHSNSKRRRKEHPNIIDLFMLQLMVEFPVLFGVPPMRNQSCQLVLIELDSKMKILWTRFLNSRNPSRFLGSLIFPGKFGRGPLLLPYLPCRILSKT